ncbi:MAG: hypothetical protein ACE5FW_01585 [Candidatus Aenigmatarchaeota archaeon]
MPIIGLSFRSIEAKRETKAPKGEIKVNSTPKINSVKEVSIPTMKKKALALTFEFITRYDPAIAEIKIGGDLIYMGENNAGILSQWKKKKSLPEKVSVEVLNHLFRRCLLKISNMADDLQLPPPIQMPRVMPKGEGAGYVG